ncbi:MAG: hypothetical protein ABW000_19245 [Actinoplanes sp.]
MRSSSAPATIVRHTVGNALVLHAREQISSEAQSLALAVAADAENDIVVLDLHDDLPVDIWESVAVALPRRRRGIRLVVCGAGQDTIVLAGQWLSDRLGQSVLAPYGNMIRGASGSLFVHTAEGSGWVRYTPGKPPVWEAKRYPRPAWDGAAVDLLPTSAIGAAEPLPGGIWIRHDRDVPAVREHLQRLTASLPIQPQALTVVLGCPGTPPLHLDDVARFWHALDQETRRRVRFVHYGPLLLPEGEAFGQALADVLEDPIVCFTGMPVGRPDRPQMHTVTPEGGMGWQVFARELSYTARQKASAPARMPRILSYRAPMALGEPIGPMVYQYAKDAVVEIVQSGLWVRPEVAPRHAERVRARHADPVLHAVVVDDADPSRVDRYRKLAEDLVNRLDPATRERSTVLLASAVVKAGTFAQVKAGGALPDKLTYSFSAADLMPEVTAAPAEPLASAEVKEPVEVKAPVEVPVPQVSEPAVPVQERAALPAPAGGFLENPAPEPIPAPIETSAVPPTPPSVIPLPARLIPAHIDLSGGEPKPARAEAARNGAAPAPRRARPRDLADLSPVELPSRNVQPPAPDLQDARLLTPELAVRVLQALHEAPAAEPDPYNQDGPAIVPLALVPSRLRFQATPDPDAQALPSKHGLAEERAWLRSSFSREFDAAGSTVSRILSEHPGFEAGPDTMVDAIAVRLYLSELGEGLDAALRDGDVGPQVPFGRCVTAGLGRLPSHRGATLLSAQLSADDIRDIRDQRILVDWGFTHALTEPPENLPGNVDVLIWSITARRTRLLEPEGEQHAHGRAVFLPGTCFKVLDAAEPGPESRGHLLLRELAADEPDRGHVPFDNLALSSLRRAVEQWAVSNPRSHVGSGTIGRFAVVPGLA